MHLWEHTDELERIPIPDLALLVVADFKAKKDWNLRNWMLETEQWMGRRSSNRDSDSAR